MLFAIKKENDHLSPETCHLGIMLTITIDDKSTASLWAHRLVQL